MNHIGEVIKEIRSTKKLSRKELAENICTEKYIYLIENGHRTPSTEILIMIGNRLSVDLFDYYKFLNCIDPIQVREVINDFEYIQINSNFQNAKKIIAIAKKMPDFQRKPWNYVFKANEIAYKVFQEQKYEESIDEIKNIIKKVDPKYVNSIYIISLYVLLSTCYQILGYIQEARDITIKANSIISGNENHSAYHHIFITCRLNLLTLYYLSGEFDKAIKVGEELVAFQQKSSSLERIKFAFAFLAFAYYKRKMYDKAFLYFNKALFILMTHYNEKDVSYIMSQDAFDSMTKDERMNEKIMDIFLETYGKIT